jgi:hypothetical protein
MRFLLRWRGGTESIPTNESIWVSTCAEVFAEPSTLVAVACGPTEAPTGLGIFVRREGLVKRLDHLGVGELAEPADLLHADGDALAELVEGLGRAGLPLFLPRILAESPTVGALRREFGASVISREVSGAPYLPLEAGVDPVTQLTSSMRADLRRATRRAEAIGPITTEVLSPDAETLPALWQEVLRVEAANWKGREKSALAFDPLRARFFELYTRRAAAAGQLRLAFLRIGGRTAAVQVAIESAGRYWLLKVGYDEELAPCSPGMILMRETLRWAAAKGLKGYELLGESAAWTRRWTELEHPCVALRVYGSSSTGLAAFGADAAKFAWSRIRGAW